MVNSGHESDNRDGDCLVYHELKLLTSTKNAWHKERELKLTAAEHRVLACLMSQPGEIFTRAQLSEALTDGESIVEPRTVDVHVYNLRRKLMESELIQAVRKVGYRLSAGD